MNTLQKIDPKAYLQVDTVGVILREAAEVMSAYAWKMYADNNNRDSKTDMNTISAQRIYEKILTNRNQVDVSDVKELKTHLAAMSKYTKKWQSIISMIQWSLWSVFSF